ncbi:MAG TPA: LamG domain-containing protein, partial [Candidatus Limnocylindria bacterium]|nr:LamG domain-containing protein [Candidatus Limnocylindria bacterium]
CGDLGDPNTINQWFLLTVVIDRPNNRLLTYRNGVLMDSKDITGLGSFDGSSLPRMGNDSDGSGHRQFKGKLDDVRVYNRALTNPEILELFGS